MRLFRKRQPEDYWRIVRKTKLDGTRVYYVQELGYYEGYEAWSYGKEFKTYKEANEYYEKMLGDMVVKEEMIR